MIKPDKLNFLTAGMPLQTDKRGYQSAFEILKDMELDGLEVEYYSIVDGNSLQDISSWDDSKYIVGCITVYCGKRPVRLIDHIKYKED